MRLFPEGVPVSKRLLDLILVLPGILVLSPILLILGLLVLLDVGAPVVFCQQRPGYLGRPFLLCKFRTMREQHDAAGNQLPDEERLTRLGRFLRSLSLDELPELFNVLKGEMSLVGPRPLLMRYLERYTPEQNRRHDVLPGLTGWAQVKGRNVLSWEDKFRFDVWYVDHRTFWLDIRILFLSIWKVLRREGISQPGHATAEEFFGSGKGDRPEK